MLTDEQIEGIVERIIKGRKRFENVSWIGADVNYLKFNGIELEFTPDGVIWKRKQGG